MKRRIFKKIMISALVIAVAGMVMMVALNLYVKAVGRSGFIDPESFDGSVDCVIVPGARVWDSGTVSYMLRDRLDMAYKLYSNGTAAKILVSGDHGAEEYDEVNAMKEYLLGLGVPQEDIFMDHAGFNTYSTMARAKRIFEVDSCIVSTQQYHLYRAVYLAKKQGIRAYGAVCDVYVSLRLPYYKLREMAARIKDVLLAEILKPDPMLGDSIPISGDGRLTGDGLS